MGDIQEKLGRFAEDQEYDSVLLNRGGLKPREKLAVKQRLVEKGILRSTMDSVRRRLAPIRGGPTKQGMEDPNDEIREIFTAIETLPQRPKELLDGFLLGPGRLRPRVPREADQQEGASTGSPPEAMVSRFSDRPGRGGPRRVGERGRSSPHLPLRK